MPRKKWNQTSKPKKGYQRSLFRVEHCGVQTSIRWSAKLYNKKYIYIEKNQKTDRSSLDSDCIDLIQEGEAMMEGPQRDGLMDVFNSGVDAPEERSSADQVRPKIYLAA